MHVSCNEMQQTLELDYCRSNQLDNIVDWLRTELSDIECRACGVEAIDTEVVQKIEEELDEYLSIQPTDSKPVIIQVQPHLLYKPGFHLRSVAPDPNSQNRLLDRICCVRSGFTVPIGAKGIIVGIQKANSSPLETMFDVVFDQPFIGNHR